MSGTNVAAPPPSASTQTLSIADIYWNGSLLDIKDGATVTIGGLRNKAVKGTRKIYSAQMMMESKITAEVIVLANVNLSSTFGTGTGELQVKCDTGQQFVWDDAFVVDAPKLTAKADGSLSVEWNAGTPTEL